MKTTMDPLDMNQETFFRLISEESKGSAFTKSWAVFISKCSDNKCSAWLLELERGGFLTAEKIRGANHNPLNLYRVAK